MSARLTPLIHVPDVRATALWYRGIGFALVAWHACDADGLGSGEPPADDAEWDWALVRYGAGEVMFNIGGEESDAPRREVDLYVKVDPREGRGVDALHAVLKDRAEVIEPPYDAFHGNRELIVRDLNGFWITFGQAIAAADG